MKAGDSRLSLVVPSGRVLGPDRLGLHSGLHGPFAGDEHTTKAAVIGTTVATGRSGALMRALRRG
jgi:hypothetical protein